MSLRERLARSLVGDLFDAKIGAVTTALRAEADERVREALSMGLARPDDAAMLAQGYRQLTTGRLRSIRELPPLAQDRMLQVVNWLRESNPLAGWLLTTTVDFTLGEGATVDSENDQVLEACRAFWDDPVNQLDLRLDKWALEFGMYGELCLPAFVNEYDGHTRLGYVDPFAIDYVLTDPENPLIRTAVVLKAPASAGRAKILKVIRENTNRAEEKTYGLLMPALPMERDPQLNVAYDGSCFLFQTNHVSNATRGRSDLLPLIDWLDGYDAFLFDSMDNANLFNSFTYDLKMEGANDVAVKARALEFKNGLKKGGVYVHNEKETLDEKSPDLKASDKNVFARDLRGHILGALSFPEHWYGLGGDVNFASAKEMGLPPVKRLTHRQKELRYILTTFLRFQLHQKMRVGLLKDTVVVGKVDAQGSSKGTTVKTDRAFKLSLPELSMRDTAGIVAATTTLGSSLEQAVAAGWIRPETAAKLYALQVSQLGFEVRSEDEFTPGGPGLKDYSPENLARIQAQLDRIAKGNGDNALQNKKTTPVGGSVSS